MASLGKPAAVHVGLPLASESPLQFWHAIEKLLLGQFRKLPNIFGDVYSREAIPPDAITTVEVLA